MSPLKLSVIVCGAAAGLAVAPYVVKQILPPEPVEKVAVAPRETVSDPAPVKLDLPIAGQNPAPAAQPVLALAAPAKEESPAQPELQLAPPELPVPAKIETVATLPSLSSPVIASAALPVPAASPTAPPPKPSPTPEIPYSAEVETAQNLMKQLGISTGKIDGKLGPNTQAAVKQFQETEGLDITGQVDSALIVKMEKAVAALPAPTPAPTVTSEPKVMISDAKSNTESELPSLEEMEISKADDPDALVVRKRASDDKKKVIDGKTKVTAASAKPKVDPGPVPTLKNMKDVKKLQAQLKEAGSYSGEVDGKWGDLTRSAMRAFQEKVGIEVTGKPNKETWLAMHSDAPVKTDEPVTEKNDRPSKAVAKAKTSEPSLSEESEDVLVTLNGDGTSKPGTPEPLATPAAVSAFEGKGDAESSQEKEISRNVSKPRVKVSTPSGDSEDKKDGNDKPNDLAVAREDRESKAAELEKEVKATRAKIQSVSNDSTYEIKKYAPKMLEAVNTMADGLGGDSLSDDPEGTKERLARITEELEKAKKESSRKKAEALVAGVRESYENLKDSFPERIKTLSLSDDEEKKQRETLTVFVADIDRGFEAMEGDFKNGKYEPIFENGKEFKSTIDEINRGLAEIYVREKLSEKTVKSKLGKDEVKEIESLIDKSEHVKAADKLDKIVATGSKKKN